MSAVFVLFTPRDAMPGDWGASCASQGLRFLPETGTECSFRFGAPIVHLILDAFSCNLYCLIFFFDPTSVESK